MVVRGRCYQIELQMLLQQSRVLEIVSKTVRCYAMLRIANLE